MSEDDPRPGDAARRALRAARGHDARTGDEKGVRTGAERTAPAEPGPDGMAAPEADAAAGEGAGSPGAGTVAPETGAVGGPMARPGDAARRALRTAAAAKDAGQRDAGAAPGTAANGTAANGTVANGTAATETAAPSGAAPAAAGVRPGARPGDAAREALRAARAQARRAETAVRETAEAAPDRAVRRSAPPAKDTARGRTAHDLKQFLGTAFRMPKDEPEPEPRPEAEAERARTDAPAAQRAPAQRPGQDARPPDQDVPQPGQDEPHPGQDEAVHGTAAHVETDSADPRRAVPATSPRLPGTMATPHRDTELRRTFPALPAPPSAAELAGTWWGNAWVRALEEGALDPRRLARGRGYAERGQVDAITVTPGLVLAYVQGSRPRPYRVQVRLRTFGADEWERFLEAAADRPGNIAALLDKELPQALAESGVSLLPGPGELEPRCSCPDFGHPCKHAAALCYQTARLLDADPFVLLLLRGRGEREVLDALTRRNAARAARERQPVPLPGVRATEALKPRRLPPLPSPLPVPSHPEQPPVYPGVPGGPDAFTLDQLATDAASRAHALLATGHDPVGELTLWQDAVRLAAARPGSGLTASTRALYASLADAVGRTPGDLARAVAAWRQGGPEGLSVLEEPWDPPAGRFDRARPLLLAADLPAFRPWRNHLTHPGGQVQLRLGRDGLWYAYESEPGHDDWWPRGTPDPDPVGALTGLGAADDL
ncbi:SWIM zinc finger family protein [Streptomyces sp. NPDC101237]|uniref:SWIM zinc finger family protein n=1 Tax=Streptomyces sp. NPDC101237 TaxID=3366139 RepID=UPI0038044777